MICFDKKNRHMEEFWVLQYPKIVAASRIDFILAHLHYTYNGYAF